MFKKPVHDPKIDNGIFSDEIVEKPPRGLATVK